MVDTNNNVLVVEDGKGVSAHVFGADGCISSSKFLINSTDLNHGIDLSPDGSKLFVSSMTTAWRYDYDPKTQTISNEEIVIKDMYKGGHSTRTLVVPPATPNLLIVSLGSNANLDWESIDKTVGRSIVKVFDLNSVPEGGYSYNYEGWYLGYGLRNEVAVVVDKNNM